MLRRLFNASSLVSLLLVVAVSALSALSYSIPAGASRSFPNWRGGFALRGGEFVLWRQAAARSADLDAFRSYVTPPRWERAGVVFRKGNASGVRWWDLRVPSAWVALASCLLPVAWLLAAWREAKRRRRRIVRSLCANCGYDLRGSTTGVCPECGTDKAYTVDGIFGEEFAVWAER